MTNNNNRRSLSQLYDYLVSPDFQRVGDNIFYNYFIFTYPAADEYRMREQIAEFEQMERPINAAHVMLLDLFDAFCDYLASESFGEKSLLESTLDEELDADNETLSELTCEANSDEFMRFVHDRIEAYLAQCDGAVQPYIFVYGVGKMYPYLRSNVFLTKYEEYNDPSRYKIILFYPGHQQGNSFKLFDVLPDSHTYRAILCV